MSPRALKIALALSVAVNLLVLCAAIAAAWVLASRWPAERPGERRESAMAIVAGLDDAREAEVRERLRASALTARPDFRAARQARREAIDLAGAETFDRAAVEAALARSRTAELNGRATLEAGLVETLAGLEAEDRRRLAPVLARRGHGREGRRGGGARRAAPQ